MSAEVSGRADERVVLETFAKVLNRESHNLRNRADILWQQMYNRLQWLSASAAGDPLHAIVNPELEKRRSRPRMAWLHQRTRLNESEALVRTLLGHMSCVNSCDYSPDGERIVSGSRDGTVRIWDTATGMEIAVLRGHDGEVNHCTYSRDGSRLLSADNKGFPPPNVPRNEPEPREVTRLHL
jgi:WD40 repeat protein